MYALQEMWGYSIGYRGPSLIVGWIFQVRPTELYAHWNMLILLSLQGMITKSFHLRLCGGFYVE
jgi:hypothetical protein